MQKISPKDLSTLLGLCYQYEDEMTYLERVEEITGSHISNIQILIQRIMSEYLKLIRTRGENVEDLEKIQNDMETTLSNWFDTRGNVKDLTNTFVVSMEKGELKFHIPLFVTLVTGFIHSRIYESIKDAYKTASQRCFLSIPKLSGIPFIEQKDWHKTGIILYPRLCLACQDFEEQIESYIKAGSRYPGRLEEYYECMIKEYLDIVQDKDKIILEFVKKKDISIGESKEFTNAIYYYIQKAITQHHSTMLLNFIDSTKLKAGVFTGVMKEGERMGLGIRTTPTPKTGET